MIDTEKKFFAVRLTEYNKGAGALLRRWICGPWKLEFNAGESTPKRPFRPSPVVEVTREQFEYIMGRNGEGVPNVSQPRSAGVPAFQGWTFNSRQELVTMVQGEADQRASHGRTGARALLVLHEEVPMPTKKIVVDVKPIHKPSPEVQNVTSEDGLFKPVDVGAELEANVPAPREEPPMSKRQAAQNYKAIKDGKLPEQTEPDDASNVEEKNEGEQKKKKKAGRKKKKAQKKN